MKLNLLVVLLWRAVVCGTILLETIVDGFESRMRSMPLVQVGSMSSLPATSMAPVHGSEPCQPVTTSSLSSPFKAPTTTPGSTTTKNKVNAKARSQKSLAGVNTDGIEAPKADINNNIYVSSPPTTTSSLTLSSSTTWTSGTRRNFFLYGIAGSFSSILTMTDPSSANAALENGSDRPTNTRYYTSTRIKDMIQNQLIDSRAITTIVIETPSENKLGLELGTTTLRNQPIVYIKSIIQQTKLNRQLQPGMILLDFTSPTDIISKLQSSTDSYPIVLQFYNLAAGGDSFNDFGQPLVTAQDALNLAKQTDADAGGGSSIASIGGNRQAPTTTTSSSSIPYSKTIIESVPKDLCAIQSRRNDVLEIDYDAYYYAPDTNKLMLYDSSSFRGTGRPYQVVLGSGDILNSVDLGLYNMCPGEQRELIIPSNLAYGPKGNKLYKIPPNSNLKWNIELISIDTTITKDNNSDDREEREGRALYY